MAYAYDDQNIFAKILRGEIPNDTVAETEMSLAFRDISPQAPTHVLVIPKGPYVNYDHFADAASDAEIADFVKLVSEVAKKEGRSPGHGGNGYRILSNAGDDGRQEVPHFHVHVAGGRDLGRILGRGED